MKLFNQARKYGAKIVAIPAVLLASGGYALAALDTGVTAAVTSYQTDMLALIGLLLAAGVAVWGAQKLGKKMGWL